MYLNPMANATDVRAFCFVWFVHPSLLLLFQEHACLLLRKAEDSGLFKVKKAERGVAICVAVTLLTCRQWRRGQTMKEMATLFDVSLKALNKAVKVSEPPPPCASLAIGAA